MTIILISSKAERDLESISDRMVSYSRKAANRLLDKILDKFETLGRFPNLGKSRDELVVGLRSFPVVNFL